MDRAGLLASRVRIISRSANALVLPGISSSGRWQFPRLQLRGSAGFSPASLSSPSGKDARSKQITMTEIRNNRRQESNGWRIGKSTAVGPHDLSGVIGV